MAESTLKPESTADAPVNKDNSNSDTAPDDTTDQAANAADAPNERPGKKRRLGVDPSLIISDGRSKRRRTPTPEPEEAAGKEEVNDPKDRVRAQALGRDIYNEIMNSVKDGESMAEPFIKLPSKKHFPDYYETIKHPMCLDDVRQKLDKQEYETLKEVTADIGQIFINAKRYNTKDSHIFLLAKKLHKTTRTFYNKATTPNVKPAESEDEAGPSSASRPTKPRRSGSAVKAEHQPSASANGDEEDHDMGGPSNASMDGESTGLGNSRMGKKRGGYMKDGPTVYKLVKPILLNIRAARSKDGADREIAAIFEKLPDKNDLPDYYNAIKAPISLTEIDERIAGRKYASCEEFYEQVELMCSNAMQYNEDESDVFRDAQQIMGILEQGKAEIHNRKLANERLSQSQAAAPKKSRPKPSLPGPVPPGPTPSRVENGRPLGQLSPYPGLNGTPVYSSSATIQPSASPAPRPSYLAPLPPGVVNEDIVARLNQYPMHEQAGWANTLTTAGMNHYRQILATQEARKRTLAGQPAPTLIDTAQTARSGGGGSATLSITQPFNLGYRAKPPQPMIKHIDCAFDSPIPIAEGGGKERHTIRLHNLRGVVMHALIIGAEAAEVEITATLAAEPIPDISAATSETTPAPVNPPREVKLKVNGNPANMGKPVYADSEGGDIGDEGDAKPVGMRWQIPIAHSRLETRLDVMYVSDGKATEQCAVYINRQF